MHNESNPEALTVECLELTRALTELRKWMRIRQQTLQDLEKYIQHGLQTGRYTARSKAGAGKKYLSDRMIATLALDCSLIKRSILLLHARERQIGQRLAVLGIDLKTTVQTDPAHGTNSAAEEGSAQEADSATQPSASESSLQGNDASAAELKTAS
ncbi:hypothetical protein EBU99_02655 [bacterium]|nr:hypothetical protein [bacterium]